MSRRRLVGDPDELTRLHAEPLPERLDGTRTGKAVEDVLAGVGELQIGFSNRENRQHHNYGS